MASGIFRNIYGSDPVVASLIFGIFWSDPVVASGIFQNIYWSVPVVAS